MIPYLKAILFDRGAFIGLFRGLFVAGGMAISDGKLDLAFLPERVATAVGMVLIVGGLMMRSSIDTGDTQKGG